MLRTLFILALTGTGLWGALQTPFYGLLLYLWIAYFRPEEWVWTGLIASLNLSLVAGVLLLVRTAFSSERFTLPWRLALLFLLPAHSLVSTAASPHPDWAAWQNFTKSIVIIAVMVSLTTDIKRYRTVMVVIGLSL